jgi:L-ornithine Nalpha-acyltransferase
MQSEVSRLTPGMILGRRPGLFVRAAKDAGEVAAAQHLRYRVFYEELNAKPDAAALAGRRDADRFDEICDHLLVIREPGAGQSDDPVMTADGEMVGTYRLLRQSVAEANGGFYTQAEFDLAPLLERKRGLAFLELGRSCVLQPFRTKPVVELLWQGIWTYVRLYGLDVMMGCASLEGTDPDSHAEALSFLAYNCASPEDWRVRALDHRYVEMRRMPSAVVDAKQALKALPPLIKGYLRLGCTIGEGAVIDAQFNTIDVLIMLPVSEIEARYFEKFGRQGEEVEF